MKEQEFVYALNKHRELKREIASLSEEKVVCKMRAVICSNNTSKSTFSLKELNKHLFI